MRRSVIFFATLLPIAACTLLRDLDGFEGQGTSSDAGGTGDVSIATDGGVPDAAIPTLDAGREDAATSRAAAYRAAVMADGPIAYYRLHDEGAAVFAKNEVPGPFLASLAGATLGQAGPFADGSGMSVRFGSGGGLTVTSDAGTATMDFLGRAPFTMEMWLMAELPEDGGKGYRDAFNNIQVDTNRTGTVLRCNLKDFRAERWSNARHWLYANADYPVGGIEKAFVHVAYVFDGTSNALFVGGAPSSINGSPQSADAGMVANKVPHVFGSEGMTLAEVAVYDKALSQLQLGTHVQAARGN